MADFLYNGVQLPELPEVEGYPYKYLYYETYPEKRYEVAYKATPFLGYSDVVGYGAAVGLGTSCQGYILLDGAWWKTNYLSAYMYKGDLSFQWTNHDILYKDSTEVYLAKSPDPVPVEPVTPVQIDPAALMQCFFVGQAIRRNRT